MKPNELMLGDWLLYNHKKPDGTQEKRYLQVVGLGLLNILLRNKEENYSLNAFGDCTELKPIPLTAEILDKNLSEDRHFFQEDKNSHLELYVDNGKVIWTINCFEYNILPLNYVHELQHALRLCGIDKEIVL